jgi:pimeloyl-ACP methyl ester carboxylesterase
MRQASPIEAGWLLARARSEERPVSSAYQDLYVTSADGLRLHARDYGRDAGDALPVICLPGLARHAADFHELAVFLSTDATAARRVLALDYRGRGLSERDRDWRNYDLKVELSDTLQVLAAAGIEKAVFVGTSRGGLITMALRAVRPDLVAGAVLNDVGPVIEPEGLMRIRGYVGKLPDPANLEEAALILKTRSGGHFPLWTDAQWRRQAEGTWHEEAGRLVLSYDPQLVKALDSLDLESPLPDLWSLFDGLTSVPVLAIRGGNSDLLSAETLQAMQQRHPDLKALTCDHEGHAPSLDRNLLSEIGQLIAKAESRLARTAAESR